MVFDLVDTTKHRRDIHINMNITLFI